VSADNFVSRYGAIYEHSAWVAERVNELLGDSVADTESLARLMADCVDNASVDAQLELIRAHPDLAGKAQVAGALTADSSEEQAKAGLDQCSPAEFEKFQALNANYIEKFGFPFIMAVRESNRSDILEAFARRLDNSNSAEFETALQEIHKIARLRLDAMEKST
jgi:2-oxo-4-hydroxy-4-carboxy-5-ureidoimidazoline decarboxylase